MDKLGTAGFIEKLLERTAGTKVYISVDIDVLDPSYAPATGTAVSFSSILRSSRSVEIPQEPGGFTTRELLTILDGLSGIEIIGADVVEVSPIYDNPGETTGLAAAEVVRSLIQLMADMPVKALKA